MLHQKGACVDKVACKFTFHGVKWLAEDCKRVEYRCHFERISTSNKCGKSGPRALRKAVSGLKVRLHAVISDLKLKRKIQLCSSAACLRGIALGMMASSTLLSSWRKKLRDQSRATEELRCTSGMTFTIKDLCRDWFYRLRGSYVTTRVCYFVFNVM